MAESVSDNGVLSLGILGEIPGVAYMLKEEMKKFLQPRYFESHDQIVFWMGEQLHIYQYFLPLDKYIFRQTIPVNGVPHRLGNLGFWVSNKDTTEMYTPNKEGGYMSYLSVKAEEMALWRLKDREVLAVPGQVTYVFDFTTGKKLFNFKRGFHIHGTNFLILDHNLLYEIVDNSPVFREKLTREFRSGSLIKDDAVVLYEESKSFGLQGKVMIARLPRGGKKLEILYTYDGCKFIVLGNNGLLVYYKECLCNQLFVSTEKGWEMKKGYTEGEAEDLGNGWVFFRRQPDRASGNFYKWNSFTQTLEFVTNGYFYGGDEAFLSSTLLLRHVADSEAAARRDRALKHPYILNLSTSFYFQGFDFKDCQGMTTIAPNPAEWRWLTDAVTAFTPEIPKDLAGVIVRFL